MNPERMAQANIDRSRQNRSELSPLMNTAYEKAAKEVLSNPDYSIQESEFTGGEFPVYDKHSVDADIATGKRLHDNFEARQTSQEGNSKKIADTLEAIVLMETEMSDWFGNATTFKTSRFDDYVNKVDMLAEWNTPQTGSQVLALGLDVTFGTMKIEQKIASIKEEIDRDKLGMVRYFKDSRGDFMGTRKNIPRTIIGVSQPVVEDLAGLWIHKENKLLGAHPIQRLLLSQIGLQLSMMRDYAAKRGSHTAESALQQSLSVIKRVRENKVSLQLGTLAEDPVWREIETQTRKQFKI